jgi:hypothetical protein
MTGNECRADDFMNGVLERALGWGNFFGGMIQAMITRCLAARQSVLVGGTRECLLNLLYLMAIEGTESTGSLWEVRYFVLWMASELLKRHDIWSGLTGVRPQRH